MLRFISDMAFVGRGVKSLTPVSNRIFHQLLLYIGKASGLDFASHRIDCVGATATLGAEWNKHRSPFRETALLRHGVIVREEHDARFHMLDPTTRLQITMLVSYNSGFVYDKANLPIRLTVKRIPAVICETSQPNTESVKR